MFKSDVSINNKYYTMNNEEQTQTPCVVISAGYV